MLILLTSEVWQAESTLKPPSGFKYGTLLKAPPRKLEPWFILWSFFLLRLLCLSINLPYTIAWNTIVTSGLVLLVATWNCYISYKSRYAGFFRVFQIAVRGVERGKFLLVGENWRFYWGGFFYQVKGTWGGVILVIQTLFKAKNSFLWILTIN